MKYVADDSTMFWAIGPNSGVIADRAEICGKEVEMVVPFEGINSGEVTICKAFINLALNSNFSLVICSFMF